MPLPDDLSTILDRLENNEQTEADIAALRQLLSADDAAQEGLRQRQIALQLGKYNVNIGQGQDIQIGDRIFVEWNDEAIRTLIEVVQNQLPKPSGLPENLPRSGVAKFVGREELLEQLHKQLQQGERVVISAVAGMAGVGKTELAIQYAKRYREAYPGGICWLFAREFNVSTQIVGFTQGQLGLKLPEGLDLSDRVAFCWRNWIPGDVLIVLDDVVNYSRDVEPYLPPESQKFKVLMTTRLKFGVPIQTLSLAVLTLEQSLELLTVLIGQERLEQESELANTLCQWLEYLPLGLELVGRYLAQRPDLSLSVMLFRLEEKAKKRQALRHPSLTGDDDEPSWTLTARRGVEAAFELSWEELDETSQHLGKLLSLFAPAPIPWSMAEAVERDYCENSDENQEFDAELLEIARDKLLRLHLLLYVKQQTYRLHALIREFFRSKLEGETHATA